MSINKSYKQGASDIGNVAGNAFEAVSKEINGTTSEIRSNLRKQTEINNGIFDIIDEHEVRLMVHEIGYKPIDMKTIYNFNVKDKMAIASIIGNISCNDAGNRYARDLIAWLGVTIEDNIDKLPKLSGEQAEACAMFLYKLLFLCNSNEVTNQIENAIDMLIMSGNDLKRIKNQVCKLSDKFGDNFDEFLFAEIHLPEKFISKPINQKKISKKIKAIVAGKTGSGKSTLINSIFDFEEAETDIGTIITNTSKLYKNSTEYIQIYDTTGIGFENEDDIMKELTHLIDDEEVNTLLYCVNAQSNRFENFEADLISKLLNKNRRIKIFIVLTCCINQKEAFELAEYIKSQTNRAEVLMVLAEDYETDVETIKSFGIPELVEVIVND